ncbi:MAG TPA: DUF1398 family protein [Edaphocola sp.]|nr:DUF1398 family protein [Edaphocola sp.]
MFTIAQIEKAHSKVKSGADFPNYIQEIKNMGVSAFETWVKDSHTDYFGIKDFKTSSNPMYEDLNISDDLNKKKFEHFLKVHQQGETDYNTFCKQCAATGIKKWKADLEAMTCTYFDISGEHVLVEQIGK